MKNSAALETQWCRTMYLAPCSSPNPWEDHDLTWWPQPGQFHTWGDFPDSMPAKLAYHHIWVEPSKKARFTRIWSCVINIFSGPKDNLFCSCLHPCHFLQSIILGMISDVLMHDCFKITCVTDCTSTRLHQTVSSTRRGPVSIWLTSALPGLADKGCSTESVNWLDLLKLVLFL